MTRAAKHEAWADYAAVLLDEQTAAFFAARVPEAKAKAAGGGSDPPSKKRKKQAGSGKASTAGKNVAEDITLRVACLDSSSLELMVPPRELVHEVKRAIGQVRDLDPGLIELFVDGKEDGLPDAGRLDESGPGSGSVVFMLHRVDWRWEACGSEMALSEGGLVATRKAGFGWQLVSGGSPMTEGRHYWEAELISEGVPQAMFIAGAVRRAARPRPHAPPRYQRH
jgi:hypothetical protein